MANNTADKVRALAEAPIESLGYRIWDVRYVKEGAEWYLRIFIDSDQGIGIDDCAAVSRLVDPILDDADIISTSYYLEVCSPGLERELSRPEHFAVMTGKSVTVRLIRAENGAKEFTGTLTGYDNGDVTLDTTDGTVTFQNQNISKVKLNDYTED